MLEDMLVAVDSFCSVYWNDTGNSSYSFDDWTSVDGDARSFRALDDRACVNHVKLSGGYPSFMVHIYRMLVLV